MYELNNAERAEIKTMQGELGMNYITEHFVDVVAELLHRERHRSFDEITAYYRGLPING